MDWYWLIKEDGKYWAPCGIPAKVTLEFAQKYCAEHSGARVFAILKAKLARDLVED